MADKAETWKSIVPGSEVGLIYFTATKATQSDTITFSDFRVVYGAWAFVDAGGDWPVEDTITRTDATANQIILGSSDTGTVYGMALVYK